MHWFQILTNVIKYLFLIYFKNPFNEHICLQSPEVVPLNIHSCIATEWKFSSCAEQMTALSELKYCFSVNVHVPSARASPCWMHDVLDHENLLPTQTGVIRLSLPPRDAWPFTMLSKSIICLPNRKSGVATEEQFILWWPRTVGCRGIAACGANSILPARQARADLSINHVAQGGTRGNGSQVWKSSLSNGPHHYGACSVANSARR